MYLEKFRFYKVLSSNQAKGNNFKLLHNIKLEVVWTHNQYLHLAYHSTLYLALLWLQPWGNWQHKFPSWRKRSRMVYWKLCHKYSWVRPWGTLAPVLYLLNLQVSSAMYDFIVMISHTRKRFLYNCKHFARCRICEFKKISYPNPSSLPMKCFSYHCHTFNSIMTVIL